MQLSQQLQALASAVAVVEGTVDGAGDVQAEKSTEGQTRLGRDSRAKARGQERRGRFEDGESRLPKAQGVGWRRAVA